MRLRVCRLLGAWLALWLAAPVALAGCSGDGDGTLSYIGGPCTLDADCPAGLECEHTSPGGICTKHCTGSSECGDGNICTDESECYTVCTSDPDCPRASSDSRYGCRTFPSGRKACDILMDPAS
jgi:hypothetical protein